MSRTPFYLRSDRKGYESYEYDYDDTIVSGVETEETKGPLGNEQITLTYHIPSQPALFKKMILLVPFGGICDCFPYFLLQTHWHQPRHPRITAMSSFWPQPWKRKPQAANMTWNSLKRFRESQISR